MKELLSELAKFNSLFTGSIFLVSKLYRKRKDIFTYHMGTSPKTQPMFPILKSNWLLLFSHFVLVCLGMYRYFEIVFSIINQRILKAFRDFQYLFFFPIFYVPKSPHGLSSNIYNYW